MSFDPTGIIQLFLRPSIKELRLEHIPGGPFTGTVIFTRPRLGEQVHAYGFLYTVVAAAPGYGVSDVAGGAVYDRDIISIAVHHRTSDGFNVLTQELSLRSDNAYILFDESFPQSVECLIAPGIQVDCWFLVRIFPV